jgi:hypothetical protein
MRYEINPKYQFCKDFLLSIPDRFEKEGRIIYQGRNTLKVFEKEGLKLCVKSFKVPHFINQIAYRYFRKSKAERSFRYATRFVELGVGTPEPVAFIEFHNRWGLTQSYYISLWLPCDFTFRGIATLPVHEQDDVYRAFTRFTYDFHTKNIFFTDHSGGNTLLKKAEDGEWHFWLVDVNRTQFTKVSPEKGLTNFRMLELPDDKLDVIATEYAKLTNRNPKLFSQVLEELTHEHNKHVSHKDWIRDTRRAIKRRLFH